MKLYFDLIKRKTFYTKPVIAAISVYLNEI